jgi:hypothetical protein
MWKLFKNLRQDEFRSGPDRVRSHRCFDCAWRRDQHEGDFNRDWDLVYVGGYRTWRRVISMKAVADAIGTVRLRQPT